MKKIEMLLGGAAIVTAGQAAAVELEVTHWWTSGGEAAAVSEFANAFEERTDHSWVDGAIAGSGSTARPIMISRITGGDPMAATQFNHGRQAEELVEAGMMRPLTAVAESENCHRLGRAARQLHAGRRDLLRADQHALVAVALAVEGVVEGDRFRAGDTTIPLDGYGFGGPATGPAWLGIRPEHVVVGDAVSAMAIRAEVVTEIVEPMGADTLVWTKLAGQPFRFRVDGGTKVAEGEKMPIGLDPARVSLFDHGNEERL